MTDTNIAPQKNTALPLTPNRLRHAHIEVHISNVHRYGVFAEELILPGELIEECPVILFDSTNPPFLINYVFNWKNGAHALALGYGSIYNHAVNPNADYVRDMSKGTLRFVAKRTIYRGEEIFVNYGENWLKAREADMCTLRPNTMQPEKKSTHIGHIIFLGLFVFIIGAITSTSTPPIFHFHSAEAATNALHK